MKNIVGSIIEKTVEVVDLTTPLTEAIPVVQVPPPLANTSGLRLKELSHYDERGPLWYWNDITIGEHTGTHFDAPIHWVSGKDLSVDRVPPAHLVAPAVVVDRSADCEADPDFLLEVEHLEAWQREHGPLPEGGWLLFRSGWDRRGGDEAAFLNADERGFGYHTPGPSVEFARWLAQETPIVGFGVETIVTDAGMAAGFDPPFPCHTFMHGAGKYGLTSLVGLDRLPATGAVLIVAPLPIVGGSGSPTRVLALVPR